MNSPDENAALPVRGSEAAALVQWLLGEARAEKVLKQMRAESQRLLSLTQKLAALGPTNGQACQAVAQALLTDTADGASSAADNGTFVRAICASILPMPARQMLLNRLGLWPDTTSLSSYEWGQPADVAEDLRLEHPQYGAAVLARIDAEQGAQVLECAEFSWQLDVLSRIVDLESISAETSVLAHGHASADLIDAAGAARPHAGDTEHLPVVNASARGARRYIDGQRCAARLIAHMSLAAQDRVLDALDDEAPGTAKRLLDRMYQFGDVATLTALDLRTLLRELDPLVLKVALGGRRCRDLEQHSRCTAKARACFTDNGHG